MAAGSTEAFSASACFDSGLLKPDPDKFWASDVLATASTEAFWEDGPEEIIKKKVNDLKAKFHGGRQLQIKHLPRDVTEAEIRDLLADLPVQSVQLQCGPGSGLALAALEEPEQPELLEEWDRERVFLLRGQRVPVTPTPTEMLLCVARLPHAFTDAQFSALVAAYGEVKRSFLMISEKTGDSKGYGFVEYVTKECAMQAKNVLDGKQIDNWILCCDWLDSSHVTFDSLHSKCLYVDKLPKDFRDMGEFRKVFGSVVNPPYCQIALKNGYPQDWGLVEFSTGEDAETAQVTLNGYSLRGSNIRICYFIPGVRAINLYLKLLNDSGNKGKAAGLLPHPPGPAVFQQLQNLAKQNPVFAQSLQNIIWTQIQALQNTADNGKKTSPPTTVASAASAAVKNKVAVNGSSTVAPDNAHAALVILLAAQMQAQMGSGQPPSLLGNPQMLATLQSIIKQGPPCPTNAPINIVPPVPARFPSQYPPKVPPGKNDYVKQAQQTKVPLLPNPSGSVPTPPAETAAFAAMEDIDHANLWNGILGQLQAQSQQNVGLVDSAGFFDPKPAMLAAEKAQFVQAPKMSLKPNSGLLGFTESMSGDLQQTLNSILNNAQNLNQILGSLTNAMQQGSAATPAALPTAPPQTTFPFVGMSNVQAHIPQEAGWAVTVPQSPTALPPPMSPVQNGRPVLSSPRPIINPTVTPGRPMMGNPVAVAGPKPMRFLEVKPGQIRQSPYQNGWGPGTFIQTSPIPPAAPPFSPYSTSPGFVPSLWSHPGSPILISSPPSGIVTPIGQKRKYNRLLPSPEPSPEGNYIGQHSQGLGGHYADSYFKRKKKN